MVAPLAEELNARAPCVFVLEDIHWADEATLDVLRLLVRRIERIPALAVASYRDDGLELAYPLRIVLGELATSRSISRLRLTGLSPSAVAELARPYGADPDELYDKSGGNPFFVVEALAAGVDAIPETVRDAVLARAARLTPAGRAVLEAVSVVPPQAELWLLGAIAGEPVEGLDECLAAGMLRSQGAGVVFRHELARLAVEYSVAPQRRLELHQAALAALSQPPDGAPDLARLAHHADAAGDAEAVLRFGPGAAAEGRSSKRIAGELGCNHNTVSKWRGRFARRGFDGLHDEPRPGKPGTVRDEDVERVIVKTLEEQDPVDPALAYPPPALHAALHADLQLLAQPRRTLVRRTNHEMDQARQPPLRPRARRLDPHLDHQLERRPQTVYLAQDRGRGPRRPRQLLPAD